MTEENKYQYTPLPEPIPITEQEWPEGTLPIVHTRTMTYMHENFIRDCIEGILMQKTTFPVQVLIHDDASTDKTAEIVREYELIYPQLIKAYYQKENTYSKKDKAEKSKRRLTFTSWRTGKYEAICEGDDYWTDPLKLQKQVDFLEANPDYGLVYTDINAIGESGNDISDTPPFVRLRNAFKSGEVFYDLLETNFITTLTVCYRAEIMKRLVDGQRKPFVYDMWSWLRLSMITKVKYIDTRTASYRRHSGGLTSRKGYLSSRQVHVYHDIIMFFLNDGIKLSKNKTHRNIFYNKMLGVIYSRNIKLSQKLELLKKALMRRCFAGFLAFAVKYKFQKTFSAN